MAAAATASTRGTTTSPTYTGTRGAYTYKLGQEVGSGGNGIVYAVSRRPELVAKIQKQVLSQHDIDKLNVLAQAVTPELLAVAAWPMDLLKSGNGTIVGFVMPKIQDAWPLYELYSPRSRVQIFPSADFRFLVHVAANVARLFGAVHKAGFICGDVNHANILVRQTGTVAVVDCDSFQVGDGSKFPCLVGTDLFVPPELMGMALGNTRRTPNHDAFGLAVLIFHLLFMGRHPFAGRFLGKGEMPIETAITECRFAYSVDRVRTQMEPPPLTPSMTTVGIELTALFERAFHPSSKTGSRPTPEEWLEALEALKLRLMPCASVPWHYHPPAATPCPWCEIEQRARIKLYGGVLKPVPTGIADLETLWARYLALVEPSPPRPLPVLPSRPRRTVKRWLIQTSARTGLLLLDSLGGIHAVGSRLKAVAARINMLPIYAVVLVGYFIVEIKRQAITDAVKELPAGFQTILSFLGTGPGDALWTGLGLALLLFAATFLSGILSPPLKWIGRVFIEPKRKAIAAVRHKVPPKPISRRQAMKAWNEAAKAWKALPPPPDVSHLRPPVEALKRELDALIHEREHAIKALAVAEPVDVQKAKFLARLRIEDARLSGIGAARCAVLRSWGIDTAADIDDAKISEIPGFGKGLTDKLVVWKEAKERVFRPNNTAVVDPIEVQKIDRRLAARRASLVKELREKISVVEAGMHDFIKLRDSRWAQVEAAFQARLQAA